MLYAKVNDEMRRKHQALKSNGIPIADKGVFFLLLFFGEVFSLAGFLPKR